jgi:hypothetical protein
MQDAELKAGSAKKSNAVYPLITMEIFWASAGSRQWASANVIAMFPIFEVFKNGNFEGLHM